MPPILFKEVIKKIRGSFGRYLSLLAIVALGVAFFAGIKASAPDMKKSADSYFDKYQVQDIQVYSTLGFNEEDIDEISKIEGVEKAVGIYTADYLSRLDSQQEVVKVISFETNSGINTPRVVEGELPSNDHECLIEADSVRNQLLGGYQIGDEVTLESPTDDAIEDTLRFDTFKIVGKAYNPNYLSYEKGTSAYGSGEVDTFIYILQSAVSADYYTECDVLVEGASTLNSYSEQYFDLVDPVVDRIEAIADGQIKKRVDSMQKEVDEARQEMDDQLAEAQKELQDGKNELDDALQTIQDGQQQILENEQLLQDSLQQLTQGWDEYYSGASQLQSGLAQIQDGIAQIDEALAQRETLLEQQEQLNQAISGIQSLNQSIASLNELQQAQAMLPNLYAQKEQLEQALIYQPGNAELTAQLEMLNAQIAQIEGSIEQALAQTGAGSLDQAVASLQNQLNAILSQVGSLEQAQANAAQIQQGLAQLDQLEIQRQSLVDQYNSLLATQSQLNEAYNTLINGQNQYDEGSKQLADARNELAQGQADYEEGLKEYEDGLAEFEEQKEEGEAEIDKAQQQISDLDGEWIVLDRESHYSYRDYEATADRMDGIASVFPVFFYLVAALVCMTTMTRMIDEERTDIGTLKALGYSRYQIAAIYLLYAGSASVLGSIIGCLVGMILFPWVIFTAWNVMYNLESIVFTIPWDLVALSSGSVILIVLAATLYSIYKELREVPAQLMRPKAGAAGKKILLERINAFWQPLGFMHKVTLRNIFRYKKRFFMTVIGIAGCSALLVSGFGINDSISDIVTAQYEDIYHYDATLSVESNASIAKEIEDTEGVSESYEEETLPVEITYDGRDVSATLHILNDVQAFEDFMSFIPVMNSPADMKLDDSGVFIAIKTAEKMGVQVGDDFTFTNGDQTITTKVSGIFDQYIDHQIYVSKTLYDTWDIKNEPTISYLLKLDGDESQIGSDLMNLDGVSGVVFYSSLQQNFLDMINSIKLVVIVLIISAAALAFVVLYNLSNVNISERKREIATIKVLGFTERETSEYVNRESLILAVLGALLGLVAGIYLHDLIMNLAELDNIRFGRTIYFQSFVISLALTIFFTLAINFVMRFKLRKIEMVESLKAIE